MRRIIAILAIIAAIALLEWWLQRRDKLDKWRREIERREIRERNPWIHR